MTTNESTMYIPSDTSETTVIEVTEIETTSIESTLQPTVQPTAKPTTKPTPKMTTNPSEYEVPIVKAVASGNGVLITWNRITKSDLVGFRVVASINNPYPKYLEDGYYCWITDASVTSCYIKFNDSYYNGDFVNFSGGSSYYFSVTAIYGENWIKVAGNAVRVTMPFVPDPLGTHPGVVLNDPVVGDNSVDFSWEKTTDEIGFSYYHISVEISKNGVTYGTGTNISDPSVTNWTKSRSDLVAGSGTYSFSITTVYSEFGETFYGLSEPRQFVIP